MVAKSVLEIDVNDDKFQSFLEKFKEYQSAIGELPAAWREAAQGIGASAKETEKAQAGSESMVQAFTEGVASIASINTGLDRLNGNLEKANKTQSVFNKSTSSAQKFLKGATKDAKSLAGHIKDATTSLISWGAIVGVFSGLVGAGGLFGINRLAAGTSAQRFTALGLGTTAGGLNSSAINYQTALGNPVATLGAIRDAQLDLGKRWQFSAMGIKNPDQDPAKLLPQMIRSARDIFVRNGSTLQGAEANGLTNFFSLDDLNRFKHMSDAEIDAMQKRAEQDSQQLQLSDQTQKQWQDFNVQVQRSGVSIENSFIRGLAPLAPQLSKLSDAFSGAIDTVLKSPELGKWIDGLSNGIQKFGNYLASPEFKSDVESFITGVERLGHAIGKVIDWITGKTNLTVDGVTSGSSMLGNKEVKDPQTGKSYIPGTDGDPRVWGFLKLGRKISGVAPTAYDDYFDEAAKKFNVNAKLLKSITGAESSWDPNAVSKAGAQGLMQVMPQNFQPGESPFNPRDNIMAGARVLADGMKYADKNGGGLEEALRYYNGGIRRGSKENIEYPSRVKEQYASLYGQPSAQDDPQQNNPPKGSAKTDQILQQILDNQRRNNGGGLTINNNTGGNAIVTSTQLGGYG